jgi:hypothetical protein
MENGDTLGTTLFLKAERYARTNIELCKLKAIDKSSDVISTFGMHLFIGVFLSMFIFALNVGIALWIGSLTGVLSYGFFIVAAFYGLLTLILFVFRKRWIKNPLRNAIISHSLS